MPSTQDTTNNSFASATVLSKVNSVVGETKSDFGLLRSGNPQLDNPFDFYKFETRGSSNLRIDLTGIKGDVKLSLYKAPASGLPNEVTDKLALRESNTNRISDSYTSTSDPTVLGNVVAGTYYIKVELATPTAQEGSYNLYVSGSSKLTSNTLLWRDPSGSLDNWDISSAAVTKVGKFNGTTPNTVPANFQMIGTGDFDSDGIDDVLWRDTTQQSLLVWFMTDGTTFREALRVEDNTGLALTKGSQWTVGAFGDIDGDGVKDLVWRNISTGEVDLWFLNSNKVTDSVALTQAGKGPGVGWQIAGFDNADGKNGADILWRNTVSNGIVIWNLDRSGIANGRALPEVIGQDWQVVAYRDFNNDNIADMLWRNTTTQQAVLWRMSATKSFEAIKVYNGLGTNYKLISSEDTNGDGRPNFMWWNPQLGVIAVWDVAADAITATGKILQFNGADYAFASPTGDWNVEVNADFSGDGNADLLWRSKSTGLASIWQIEDYTFKKLTILKDPTTSANIAVGSNASVPGVQYAGYIKKSILQTQTSNSPKVTAGSSRVSAFNLGVLDGFGSFKDTIGGSSSDKVDWYKFTTETPSFLTSLVATSATTSLVKASVFAEGSNNEITNFATATFKPGSYYISVRYVDSANDRSVSPYELKISGKPGITNLAASVLDTETVVISLDPLESKNPVKVKSFKFTNIGDFAADNFDVAFYISRDNKFGAEDQRLSLTSTTPGLTIDAVNKVVKFTTVNKGVTIDITNVTLTLPGKNDKFWQGTGDYSIIAVIDPDKNLTNETKKDDNASSKIITIQGAGAPDLRGKTFTSPTTTLSATSAVSGSFTIENIGGVNVTGTAFNVSVYFSTQNKFNSSAFVLKTIPIPATTVITPQGTASGTFNVTDLATNPEWQDFIALIKDDNPGQTSIDGFIGIVVDTDSVIFESDEGNNSGVGTGKDWLAAKLTF